MWVVGGYVVGGFCCVRMWVHVCGWGGRYVVGGFCYVSMRVHVCGWVGGYVVCCRWVLLCAHVGACVWVGGGSML